MTPQALLLMCEQAGVMLKWDGRTIKACGEERSVSLLLPILKTHKAALQAFFKVDDVDFYEERAAIAQYDGGMSRSDAEAQAFAELETWRNNHIYR